MLPDITSMVMNDDSLRPQSTFGYNKGYASKPYDFPELYIDAPIAVMNRDPVSTRASIQNLLFAQRYFDK
jgi:hypothetical protein